MEPGNNNARLRIRNRRCSSSVFAKECDCSLDRGAALVSGHAWSRTWMVLAREDPRQTCQRKNIENSCGFQTDRRSDLGIPAEFLRSVPKIPQVGLTGFQRRAARVETWIHNG